MPNEIVKVTIGEGTVTAEAHGFVGNGCAKIVDSLMAALGRGKVLQEGKKKEYFQQGKVKNELKQTQ